jgi:glycosyltransferase involved in cell wall biosynthesis
MARSCKVSLIMPCFNRREFLSEAVGRVNNNERSAYGNMQR